MLKKNQTHSKYFFLVEGNPRVKGVGLFIYKNQVISDRPFRKDPIPDISYNEAVNLGQKAIAFKFIPYDVTIRIKGEQYHLSSFRIVPEKYWKCSGVCTCDGREGNCIIDDTCMSIEGQCY